MKILESCKQKIENRMPRVRVDRGWAEAEWHHAITPRGGGLSIARDSPALLQVWLGRVPFVFVRVLWIRSRTSVRDSTCVWLRTKAWLESHKKLPSWWRNAITPLLTAGCAHMSDVASTDFFDWHYPSFQPLKPRVILQNQIYRYLVHLLFRPIKQPLICSFAFQLHENIYSHH